MRILKSTLLPLVALCFFHPPSASAWTWDANCENGAPGAAVGPKDMTDAFTLTTYSNAQAATGKQSCKLGITAGSDGWGIWGGTFAFPSAVGNGGQLWTRVSLFVPQGFNVTTDDGILKFMRLHTQAGFHDLLISTPGNQEYNAAGKLLSSPAYVYNFEGFPNLQAVGNASSNSVAYGKWETYEMYIKFDTVARSSGGTGEVRIWKNNQLLLDYTSGATLTSSSDRADYFYLFTYWNGTAPATQSLYTDDIILTSDTPTNKDSAGNPCICGPTPGGSSTGGGTSGGSTATTPQPPSNVTVQ